MLPLRILLEKRPMCSERGMLPEMRQILPGAKEKIDLSRILEESGFYFSVHNSDLDVFFGIV
jgi:hypothetical protein